MLKTVFAKTRGGLWVRTTVNDTAVQVAMQEQFRYEGPTVISMGPNGQERWRKHLSEMQGGAAWVEVGQVVLGPSWEALEVDALEWDQLICGLQHHLVGLIAAGWGDPVEEVLTWFQDPIQKVWIVSEQLYEIIGEYDPLLGLHGMFFMVEVEEDQAWMRFVGMDLPRIPLEQTSAWMRAFLMVTRPIVNV